MNFPWKVSFLRTATPGNVPSPALLAAGQPAFNTADRSLYVKADNGTVVQIGVAPGDIKAVAYSGSYNDLTDKPNISGEYVLPVATSAVLGGVKQGSGVTIAGDGTLNAAVTSVNTRTGAITLSFADVGLPTDFLDVSNKIRVAYLPDSVTAGLQYKGTYNASTNTPALPDAAAGNTSWLYVVNVAGTATFPTQSSIVVDVGDWLISNGTSWERVPLVSGNVTSVNGNTGNVTINATNLPGLSQVGKDNLYSSLTGIPSFFTPDPATVWPATQITGLATVATSGSYNDLDDLPPNPAVAQISMTVSGNPAVLGEDDYLFTRNATFPANFAGSKCRVTLTSGTTATINILRDGSLVGTIVTNTSTGAFSSVGGAPIDFTDTQALTFQYATTNIAKFTVNLKGTWTS